MQEENKYKTIYIDSNEDSDDEIDLREVFENIIRHWKWFVLGTVMSLILAYVYLRYTPRQYEVSSTILIDDKDNGSGMASELSAFEDLGLITGSKTSLENEIGILQSRTLLEQVIRDLGVNVTYHTRGKIASNEIFQDQVPFKINFLNKDPDFYTLDTTFTIAAKTTTEFDILNSEGDRKGQGAYGEKISTDFGEFIITPKNIKDSQTAEEIVVKISPLKSVVNSYREEIKIEPVSKKGTLLNITLKDPIRNKALLLIDRLVYQYNENAVADKSIIANNTSKFIEGRLEVISQDLTNVDKGVEEFKTTNKLTNLSGEANLVMESSSELEKKIIELNTQIKMVDYLSDHIHHNTEGLIPDNLGLTDEMTGQNTANYNKLLLERNRILSSSSKLNPVIANLEEQLAKFRESIGQSLVNLRSSLTFSLRELKAQERSLDSRISSAPKQERELRDIRRQQQIIETLYLYLLQKREENAITLAATLPNAKIIDKADGSDIPVSPMPKIIYLIAAILGLVITFIIISLRAFFDNKVHTVDEIEGMVKAPILGDIPKIRSENKIVISEGDRSNYAESFRLLRTNVNFMLPGVKEDSKTIFITSTLSMEGKTSIAINLSSVLSSLNKKVLLIGADIRRPKIATYLHMQSDRGLTHYLTDTGIRASDVIRHHEASNVDIIESGAIPPNPSELLTNGRFDELVAYGKKNYDYVIVDTAPVNLVTDTLLLGHLADLFIYVIRANYLDKRLLKVPKMMYDNKRLPNMAILLNDTNFEEKGYGYGYGYGYSEDDTRKTWWKKVG